MTHENLINRVEAAVTLYQSRTKTNPSAQDWREDLIQETHLVLLEGYGGAKVDGDIMFAVQMAARRMDYTNACDEFTGQDMTIEEGFTGLKRDSSEDFVQQLEVDDWVENRLRPDQKFVTRRLLEGHTQAEIAADVGVSQSTIHRVILAIQREMKEDFNVN